MRRRRVLQPRYFQRWAREHRLADEVLLDAVSEMEQGLVDADLDGGVVKKRIGVCGRGKRGGTRVILATLALSESQIDDQTKSGAFTEIIG
jgi:hypothetical protein